MLTVTKHSAQKYSITAERGKTKERDDVLKSLYWKKTHRQEGYMFSPKYKSGSWSGHVNVFKPTNIRMGYLKEALDELNKKNVAWSWDGDELPSNLPVQSYENPKYSYEEVEKFCQGWIDKLNKKQDEIDFELREYQVRACFRSVNSSLGICQHSTGAGKSLVISFILGFLAHKKEIEKVLIIVPRQNLITQFRGDMIEYGIPKKMLGLLYGEKKETTKPITIATYQTLSKMIGTPEAEEFFPSIDLCLCDEVHMAKAKTLTNSVLELSNVKYQYGLTGTLPEDPLKSEIIHSLFGQVIDHIKHKDIKGEDGTVSNVTIGLLVFSYGLKALASRTSFVQRPKDYWEEIKFLQDDDEFLNKVVIDTLVKNYESDNKLIGLVKHIEYGEKFYNKLRERLGKRSRVYWIDGSMKLADRDKIIKKCKKNKKGYILLSNYQVFSTGINIPNISHVILLQGGKSRINICQSIGRGVRKTKQKSNVYILDISADLKYSYDHLQKRRSIYEEEGFTVIEKTVKKGM